MDPCLVGRLRWTSLPAVHTFCIRLRYSIERNLLGGVTQRERHIVLESDRGLDDGWMATLNSLPRDRTHAVCMGYSRAPDWSAVGVSPLMTMSVRS